MVDLVHKLDHWLDHKLDHIPVHRCLQSLEPGEDCPAAVVKHPAGLVLGDGLGVVPAGLGIPQDEEAEGQIGEDQQVEQDLEMGGGVKEWVESGGGWGIGRTPAPVAKE